MDFDKRLARHDIQGSLAHADMLAAQGIISAQDLSDIQRGMTQIRAEIEAGSFQWLLDLEDVHLNIEKRLVELVGDAGKRLHTGRSRNDQVATDIRLWLREEIDTLIELLRQLRRALATVALDNAGTIMPGFTHLQVAQPVTFGHHLLAYAEMFGRDAERLADCRKRVNRLPLGAAALAGTSYPIDRERVARTLGFDGVCRNSLDAVSDRDFAIEFCAAGAGHDARLAPVRRAGAVDEPARGLHRPGRPLLHRQLDHAAEEEPRRARAGARQGRPRQRQPGRPADPDEGPALAYNKDNQEDKEGLFDTVDTLRDTLTIFADMAGGIKVKADNMRAAALQGFATATDLADYLVKRGLPFRDAHEVVAHAVRDCEQRGCDLADLTLAELQAYNADIGEDVHQVLTLEGSVAARKHVGGTAPSASPRKPAACWRRRLASKARACSDAKDGPGLIQGRLFASTEGLPHSLPNISSVASTFGSRCRLVCQASRSGRPWRCWWR